MGSQIKHLLSQRPCRSGSPTKSTRHNYKMLHIIRGAGGAIFSISAEPVTGSEPIQAGDPELLAFLNLRDSELAHVMKDIDFVRVIEDVIDALIKTNVIRLTDLPEAAQHKLISRKGLRDRRQGSLDLIGNDDSIF